ncbi:MAG TPA: acetyl-CoA carboxylase carboxyltransferase subunit alpha [Thermomicrobiales bacterium]|jgi:acetyl-CoA carboxylase carboxyl transferase subunit alpha|nr:acetyl-CoA carboxylase carboxyltransferase subunit alpha [Thermomicrobiales bacterium]
MVETATLTAWDRVKLARHPERPHTLDYLRVLAADFIELHGDRVFGDDHALVGGLARFDERTVLVLGHQKGGNTRENIDRNFGMARPEGYRKAERLMRHAEKFRLPIIAFIDTSGAEPGIGAEERGQATAIAESLYTMAGLRVPIVAVVIGEGGSGGALAIGVADRLLMLENAIYAVASPEGCAAILWKDAAKAPEAAATMRITANDLLRFGIIDEIIPEPGPAHERREETIATVGQAIARSLDELIATYPPYDPAAIDRLLDARYEKFRRIGAWRDEAVIAERVDSSGLD